MTALERFAGPVRRQLEDTEQRLDVLLADMARASALPDLYAQYVEPPVRHLFLSGGKLLRPLLLLLSARAVGTLAEEASAAAVRAAAAVELIHTASLAHDDMADGSEERRGAPSLHRAFGATAAVLVGDLLYSRFFKELAALPRASSGLRVTIIDIFLSVTARMCEGEILEEQMRACGAEPSFETYLSITESKTADLVSACCRVGAMLNGASEEVSEILGAYGRQLGVLFQIADDLADGDPAFTDRRRLEHTAQEYRASAESLLRALPPAPSGAEAAAVLAELPGHIAAPLPR